MDNQQRSLWIKLEECNLFEINEYGIIRYISTKMPRKLSNTKGYKGINFYKSDWKKNKTRKYDQYLVHRLVAKYFISNPLNKPCVNHIDGNKINNHKSNLEWCTHKENTIHAINSLKAVLGQKGENHRNATLTKQYVIDICKKAYELHTINQLNTQLIAEEYGVCRGTICGILNGTRWKSVTKEIPYIPIQRNV